MDPISAKLTTETMNKVGGGAPLKTQQGAGGFDQSSFGRLLDNQMQTSEASTSNLMQFVDKISNESTTEPMKAVSASDVHVDFAKAGDLNGQSVTKPQNIFDILKDVNSTQANMDQVMETLTSGKHLSTMEMTRLQVLAHMNTVNMEVISKVGEMANKAIQTPFQMNVG